ncbi:MAG: hypothetical protein EOO40_11315, partial [Deltaproteobacteria bacterium]
MHKLTCRSRKLAVQWAALLLALCGCSRTGFVQSSAEFPVGQAFALTLVQTNSLVAGEATSLMLTALDGQAARLTNYTGNVSLSADDANATLPAAVTFVAGDQGQKILSAALVNTHAGQFRVTATSSANQAASGTSTFLVNPGAVAQVVVATSQTALSAGDLPTVAVAATDRYGNVVPSYTGSVLI